MGKKKSGRFLCQIHRKGTARINQKIKPRESNTNYQIDEFCYLLLSQKAREFFKFQKNKNIFLAHFLFQKQSKKREMQIL